ncbi:Scr1 family TA system antitoxin-like transcriptional regulator [Streptomyces sp. C36]|uniref:helix-turn-helix domain-containing protein n=1 Tax=Streptomyces sp. C36 TaxID=3237122 RepID=UPI0034C61A64
MTQPRNSDPYADARAFYGSELRRLREDAGFSQDQLGQRAFCSGTYIGQFETAVRRPQLEISKLLDEALGSGEHLQRLCRLSRASKGVASYFADAADLQLRAKTISEYSPVLMPGLLQTEEYARAVVRAAQPFAAEDKVEEFVRARVDRQQLLDDTSHPLMWIVLQESTLWSHISGSAGMQRQLMHVIEMAQRPRIIVQVLPFTAMAEAFMDGMVMLMDFSDAPPVVYTEGARSGQLIEDTALVESNWKSYDLVRAAALSPASSLSLLESTAEGYGAR